MSQETIDQAMRLAFGHHQAGRLAEARAIYLEVLALDPSLPDPLDLLGVIAIQTGQFDQAVEWIRQAIAIDPRIAGYHSHLGNALRGKGQYDEAIAAWRVAIGLKGDFAEAYANLGNALRETGQIKEAVDVCRQAVRLNPGSFEALTNLGAALQETGQSDEAIIAFRQALRINPDVAETYNNLGNALRDTKQLDEAIVEFQRAVELKPESADIHRNLGTALCNKGRFDEAIAAHRQAIRLKPDFSDAYNNLGVALDGKGEYADAITAYQQCLRIQPDFPGAHLNLGLIHLIRGDFRRGWPEYEWRLRVKDSAALNFSQPRWNGEDLKGRVILLHNEQGLGDAIQFVRYAPLVAARGGEVILYCQDCLKRVLSQIPSIEQVICEGESLPRFDVQCPLLSLPLIFKTDLNSIPAAIPYLKSDLQISGSFANRLAAEGTGRRVGLIWAGSPEHRSDRHRSVTLDQLAPLAGWRGATFFSLQKGEAAAEARHPPAGMKLIDWTADLHDFADTAALIDNLDLVISVDTAPAHLAAAMGKPVWVLLQYSPDWRWLLEREDSPWYPTVRLFRQKAVGDWTSVIRRMSDLPEPAIAGNRNIVSG
jgi:tetratricopeptide (TPR) repeat protein